MYEKITVGQYTENMDVYICLKTLALRGQYNLHSFLSHFNYKLPKVEFTANFLRRRLTRACNLTRRACLRRIGPNQVITKYI